MKFTKLAAFLAAAVLAFALAGCSGSQAQKLDEETLSGYWALDPASGLGFDAYLFFSNGTSDSDGASSESSTSSSRSFTMMLVNDYLEGSWSTSGTEGTLNYVSESYNEQGESSSEVTGTAKFTYDGSRLTVGSPEGSKLLFVKNDSEEVKEMFGVYEESIESIDTVTVADDNQFKVEVTGKGNNKDGEDGYQVSVSNKTDKNLYVECDEDFKVAGEEGYAYFELEDIIAAGKTADGFLAVESESGETSPATGTLLMYDADILEKLFDDYYAKLEAEAGDEGIELDDEGPDTSSAVIARYTVSLQ